MLMQITKSCSSESSAGSENLRPPVATAQNRKVRGRRARHCRAPRSAGRRRRSAEWAERACAALQQRLRPARSRLHSSSVGTAIRVYRLSGRELIVPHDLLLVGSEDAPLAASMAWSRSAMMSRMSSMPTESRTSSGVTPVAACSSTESCWWVVEAG